MHFKKRPLSTNSVAFSLLHFNGSPRSFSIQRPSLKGTMGEVTLSILSSFQAACLMSEPVAFVLLTADILPVFLSTTHSTLLRNGLHTIEHDCSKQFIWWTKACLTTTSSSGYIFWSLPCTVEPACACKVHRSKVFSDVRSISSWSQSESAILSYNPDVRSAQLKVNFLWTKCWPCKRAPV